MGLTTDPNEACLKDIKPNGQQCCYLILSEEERKKGFMRPVRYKYLHLRCGTVTTMDDALSETYARDPKFYGGTFCCHCGTHFRLQTFQKVRCNRCEGDGKAHGADRPFESDGKGSYPGPCPMCNGTGQTDEFVWQFEWQPDGDPVGSDAEEAKEYLAAKKQREAQKHVGEGI